MIYQLSLPFFGLALGLILNHTSFRSSAARRTNPARRGLAPPVVPVAGRSRAKSKLAPFPVELAERLIRLFSFAGDTVLDPFAGTGSTALAAMACGRNSVSVEIEPKYLAMAEQRLREAVFLPLSVGAVRAKLKLT